MSIVVQEQLKGNNDKQAKIIGYHYSLNPLWFIQKMGGVLFSQQWFIICLKHRFLPFPLQPNFI